jgi:very-short-patch-repair endonuclease
MDSVHTVNARKLRHDMTDAERCLWRHLRQLDGHKFRRQQPIGPYIVDFVCDERRLIVEVDRGQHVDCHEDRRRDEWLTTQGFRVLRFWNNDVLKNTQAVVSEILALLRNPIPPPQSSPARGEEVVRNEKEAP